MKFEIIPSARDPIGLDLRLSFKIAEITDKREIEALKAKAWRWFQPGKKTICVDIPLS